MDDMQRGNVEILIDSRDIAKRRRKDATSLI